MKKLSVSLCHIFLILALALISDCMYAQTSDLNNLLQRGQFQKALPILDSLSSEDSLNIDLIQKRALCYLKSGNQAQAKKLYQKALILDPDGQESNLQLSYIFEQEGNPLKALAFFRKLYQLDSSNTFFVKGIAKNLIRVNRRKEGIAFLKKAIQMDSLDVDSVSELANIYLNDQKDDLAEPLVKKAILLNESSIRIRQISTRLAYRKKDFEKVRQEVNYMMSLGDTTALYQRLLGTAYFNLDSNARSLEIFQRLVRIGEESETIRAGIAYAFLGSAKTTDSLNEAIDNFNQAIELGSSDAISDYKLGIAEVFSKKGEFTIAISLFKEVYNVYKRPKAVFRLGEIYEKNLKDMRLAESFYREYLRVCQASGIGSADEKYVELVTKKLKERHPQIVAEPVQFLSSDTLLVKKDTLRNK